MTQIAVIDDREITITPVFKHVEVENIPKSETAGRAVMETREMVEVRFAGSKNYSPMFPTNAFWKREGNNVITYAERWPDQYRAFKEGNPQEANGTPLEMLRDHGVTPELISLCRALRIYSIESLYHLEGKGVKSLGMHANRLKDAAREFMSTRLNATDAMSEIEKLRAEIAAMRAGIVPVQEPSPEEVEQAEAAAGGGDADPFEGKTDAQLKDDIEELCGARPRGNPSRPTLTATLQELLESAS